MHPALAPLPAWRLEAGLALVAWAVVTTAAPALVGVPALRRLDLPGAVVFMMVGLSLPPMVVALRASQAGWSAAGAGLWLVAVVSVCVVAVVRLGRRREWMLWVGQGALVVSALVLPVAVYLLADTTGRWPPVVPWMSLTLTAASVVRAGVAASLPALLGWTAPAVALAAWSALDDRHRQADASREEVFGD